LGFYSDITYCKKKNDQGKKFFVHGGFYSSIYNL